MKKAYIILAHKYPDQLLRLVQRLTDELSFFFIHIDKKSEAACFNKVFELQNVQPVENVRLHWGGYSFVQAILNGMKAVKNCEQNIEHIILLSGQDYPVKDNATITKFLHTSPHKIFIEHFRLPNHEKWQPGGGMYRVDKYYFGLGMHQKFTAKTLNFLSSYNSFIKRQLPGNMKPFAGSTWWIMDMYALNYLLDYVNKNPAYVKFHKRTFAADELFFQMILLNTTDKRLAKSISGNNKRFIKWKKNAANPETLHANDVDDIIKSDALFARKFDMHTDTTVLDMIDERCLHIHLHANKNESRA